MAKRVKKDEVIFETFGHVAIVKTAAVDKQSILKIIITVDANKSYSTKKKKGRKGSQ